MSRKRIICILICLLLFVGMLYFISTRNKSSSTATGSEVSTATTQMQQADEGKGVAEPATEAKNLIAEEQTQNSIQKASTQTSQNQEEAVKEETTNNEAVTSAQEVSKEEAPAVEEAPKTEQNPPAVTEEKAPVANESEAVGEEKEAAQKEQANEAAKDVTDEKTANQEVAKEQTSQKELSEKAKEIELEIKDILRLNKIEFETASAVITPKGEVIIVKIAEVLKKYPNIKVEIAGHTDKAGNKKFNQKLSQDRANSVKEALIKLDIDSSRLVAKGYGDSKPLVKRNEEDIQQNRRVEFHIIEE